MRVREAVVEDAEAIGDLHVRAWQAAYRGTLPDDYLDGLSADDRVEGWRGALQVPPRVGSVRLVAEDDVRGVVGFIVVGPNEGQAETGEVYALNVDPDVWGSGAGGALLDAGTAALETQGFAGAILWVIPGNTRARRFYERAGWRVTDRQRHIELHGVEIDEVAYERDLLDG